jgi:hypothetical protein
MWLYKTKTETGFYETQFRFFQPELEYFLTIPVPEFDRKFCEKSRDNLKSVYFGLICILNMKV